MTRRLLLAAAATAVAIVPAGCGGSAEVSPEIAFVSTRDGDYAIYGMSADGGHQRRLTDERGDPSTPSGLFFQIDPAWSPDGRSIAFASKRDGVLHVFVMKADGSETRRLTSGAVDDGNPTWSPDGSRIAFERDTPGDIYVMNADGSGVRPLVEDGATESDPAWSPDGSWIAYVRRVPGTPVKEIWLVHPHGSRPHRLVRFGLASVSPAWAPDGKRIAFASDGARTSGLYAIYTVGQDGKAPRRLTTVISSGAFEPSWSSDGTKIAYASDGSIFTVSLVGSQEALTENENDSSPVWRPAQPSD
jgi:Tol biopolymer transport system component